MTLTNKMILSLVGVTFVSACQVDQSTLSKEELSSPQVIAALPSGVPAEIVFKSEDGCYAYAIEETDPLVGYPLRDRNGNPICPN